MERLLGSQETPMEKRRRGLGARRQTFLRILIYYQQKPNQAPDIQKFTVVSTSKSTEVQECTGNASNMF